MIECSPDDFTGSDTDRVQAAFDAVAKSNTAGHVRLQRVYSLTRPLTFPDIDGFTMTGFGPLSGFRIDSNAFPQLSYALSSAGARGVKFHSTLSARATIGARTISVKDPAQFAEGSSIRLMTYYTAADGSVVNGFQHNRIVKKQPSGALDLELPMVFPCEVGAYCDAMNLRRGLRLVNFSFTSKANVEHNAIVLINEREAIVENLSGTGMGRFAGTGARGAFLVLSDGYRNQLRGVSADECGANGEDGIAMRLQSGLKACDITATNSTFGIGMTYLTDSQVINASSENDNGRAIKLWAAKRVAMANFRVAGARHVAFGLSGWTTDCTLTGFDFRDVAVPEGQGTGIWFNGQSNNSNTLIGGVVRGCSLASVSVQAGDAGNVVKGVFDGPLLVGQGSTSVVQAI